MPSWSSSGEGGGVPVSKATPIFVAGTCAPTLTTGADTTPTAGTVYLGSIFVPHRRAFVGVGYLIGSVGGTDTVDVILYDSLGKKIATSNLGSPATVGTTATFQEVAFATPALPILDGPGTYYVGIAVSGNTCRLRLSVAAGSRGDAVAGSYGTYAAITPPASNVAAPIAYLY